MPASAVRWFHSGMFGAPVLAGQPAAQIAVLDACLKDGFDPRTINTLTVSGGVATATISAGHVYDVHAVIRVAGVTGALAALNDDWRITSATGSTLTFACPGVADGSATGTITCKRAPAGWGKPFAATNKAVYQSANLAATRLFLRVDDAAATVAQVRGYESMSDVDTGSNLFPTIAQVAAASLTWGKSSTADATARSWGLFADDQGLYFFPRNHATTAYAPFYAFGDLDRMLASDAYHCMVMAHGASSVVIPYQSTAAHILDTSSSTGCYLARAASQAVGATTFVRGGHRASNNFGSGAAAYSAALDGQLHLHAPVLAYDGAPSANPPRGILPGILQPLQSSVLNHAQIVDGEGAYAGRAIMLWAVAGASGEGRVAIDITGPWR